MLAPFRVQVPASYLVSVPVPVLMMLSMRPPMAPPRVRPKPLPIMVPALLSRMLPVSPTIDDALPSVTKPA